MSVIDQPWTRVRNPVELPETPDVERLIALGDVEFAELVRSHLVPRDQSQDQRSRWDRLWLAFRSNTALTDRVYDVLEDFLDDTEQALAEGAVPQEQVKRARKFAELCKQSWARIDRERVEHLGWAGKAGDFQPHARRVIATLISAIATHRATVLAKAQPTEPDLELWAAMRKVGLDPEDYARQERRHSEAE